jgi:hypothetical protein
VKAVLPDVTRTIGAARQGKNPATADVIGKMLPLCPDSLVDKRDRALLVCAFAGAFRRSVFCALGVADLTETRMGSAWRSRAATVSVRSRR